MFSIILNNLIILASSLFLLIKGATLATKYASQLARSFNLSSYTIGFIVVAVISILPETFISINAALVGIPSFGLGVLFGSNVADLTLVFALIIMLAGRGIQIESKILQNNALFPLLLLLPLALGTDGYYSRTEGVALIVAGAVFYFAALRNGVSPHRNRFRKGNHALKNVLFLLGSMTLLIFGAHFIVTSATALAYAARVSPILIGMFIVGLGTTMPELLFSLTSIKKHHDALAIGDILGTVLADATVVVGILALVRPFAFPPKIVYLTGACMVAASLLLLYFMRSGRRLTQREAFLLLFCWILFVLVEFALNT